MKSLKSLSFPKKARVRKRREYLNFLNKHDTHKVTKRFGVCIVYKIPNQSGNARIGITVKFKTTSVVRNKIKRLVRESFRKSRAKLGNFDFNVVVPSKITTPSQKKQHELPFQIRDAVEGYFESLSKNI